MRLAYFDCFSGISGEMALGALAHAGANLEAIAESLGRLPVEGVVVRTEAVETHGIAATKVHFAPGSRGVIRTYASIRSMLAGAPGLPDRARWRAQRILRRLAQAEAKVHGKELDVVIFHGPGERDTLVDVLVCSLALEQLGVDRVFASPVPTGLGMVRSERGVMPVPSPVVVELLQGVPTFTRGIPTELVTPVGAAILSSLAEGYGDMPTMRVEHVGYGAGAPRPDFPNVLRVAIGEDASEGSVPGEPPEVLVQANVAGLDPANVERLGAALEDLVAAGAVEAWCAPFTGPDATGVVVSAVCARERAGEVARALAAVPGAGPGRLLPVGRA